VSCRSRGKSISTVRLVASAFGGTAVHDLCVLSVDETADGTRSDAASLLRMPRFSRWARSFWFVGSPTASTASIRWAIRVRRCADAGDAIIARMATRPDDGAPSAKRCPFCGEDNAQDSAIVCWQCGRDLSTSGNRKARWAVWAAWLVVGIVIVGLLSLFGTSYR